MKRKPTQADTARAAGVSTKTLRAWRSEGLDITNLKAVMKRAAHTHGRTATSEDMAAAKLRKMRADADRAQTTAKREAGLLVELASIKAQGESIGRAVGIELDRLLGTLPGMCGGRPAAEIFTTLKRAFREARTNLQTFKYYEQTND